MLADPTPDEWFERLNAKFTTVTRPAWKDHAHRATDVATCSRELRPRDQLLDSLWSYYVGDPPLPQVEDEYRDVFKDVMRKARSNYAPMCVNATADRMEITAISTTADNDANGDDLASRIMDESGFGARSKDLFVYAFAMGESYGMAVPGDLPSIHAIDPRRCVGSPDPLNPVRLRAALVRDFDDITDELISYLFLPGRKWELRSKDGFKWQLKDAEGEAIPGLEKLGGMPIVRFDNLNGMGEYEPHIDLLDRINDTTLQRIIGFWYQALRQRALKGDPEDDEDGLSQPGGGTGLDSAKLKAGPGALWLIPKEFDIWESQQSDFGPFINAKRDDVKEFAAVTSTPLHLITPDAANGSAEGAGLMRESATSKVRDRRARFTPPMKLLWRIAFAMANQDRGPELKLHWGPIEFRTLAERASAAMQSQNILSRQTNLEQHFEMTPQDAAREVQRATAEALLLPTPRSGTGDSADA